MSQKTDIEYEQWKRDNGLDRRGFPNAPVLPSESKASFIANASMGKSLDERDED
jgi:hypothetical protein